LLGANLFNAKFKDANVYGTTIVIDEDDIGTDGIFD
jgi:hypothetical protein